MNIGINFVLVILFKAALATGFGFIILALL